MTRTLLLSVLLIIAACASARTAAEKEIRAQYDVLERAFAARDAATIIAMRDEDLEVIGPNGQHDGFEQMAEYTRQWFVTNQPPIVTRFTIESIEMKSADEAAVRVLQWASRYQERDGKLRKVEHEVRQRETWIRTPSGWKIRKVDEIDLAHRKRWIDGVLEVAKP
jgi:ketosteroid isomerase-like protein